MNKFNNISALFVELRPLGLSPGELATKSRAQTARKHFKELLLAGLEPKHTS